MITEIRIGDTYEFPHRSGYVLSQNRPFACRRSCGCGQCNGRYWTTTETIIDVIHYADNSTVIVGSDGSRHTTVGPHGDRCF